MAKKSVAERFWPKVDKSGGPDACWLWTGAGTTAGYGMIGVGGRRGRPHLAHRVSWELANGPIPCGMLVCHRCDVRGCVNPKHLFLGTQTDNMKDCKAKGRNSKGDTHYSKTMPDRVARGTAIRNSKLTPEVVCKIRQLVKTYRDACDLSCSLGVSVATVLDATHRRTWKWVE